MIWICVGNCSILDVKAESHAWGWGQEDWHTQAQEPAWYFSFWNVIIFWLNRNGIFWHTQPQEPAWYFSILFIYINARMKKYCVKYWIYMQIWSYKRSAGATWDQGSLKVCIEVYPHPKKILLSDKKSLSFSIFDKKKTALLSLFDQKFLWRPISSLFIHASLSLN